MEEEWEQWSLKILTKFVAWDRRQSDFTSAYSEIFFFNANVLSGLQAQIIICLLALLLRAADEIFLWLLYYMLSKKLANCVCLFPCSVCLERGDRRGIFMVHWADPVLQGWTAPQHDFGWWWRSYQPSSYQIPTALERWLVFCFVGYSSTWEAV